MLCIASLRMRAYRRLAIIVAVARGPLSGWKPRKTHDSRCVSKAPKGLHLVKYVIRSAVYCFEVSKTL